MPEEIKDELTNVSGEQVDMTPDYLAAIKELKEKSVDRSKYDELMAENKKLLSAVVNGQTVDIEAPEQKASIQDLREKVFNNPNQSNLEYITNVLKLRTALMENGESDPFVASSSQYSPTAADYETANKVAKAFQDWVDTADGDPEVFLNEYTRNVKDINLKRK